MFCAYQLIHISLISLKRCTFLSAKTTIFNSQKISILILFQNGIRDKRDKEIRDKISGKWLKVLRKIIITLKSLKNVH